MPSVLTDRQGLRLIADMLRNTQNGDIVALCDWVLALVQRQQAVVASAAPKASKTARAEYMKHYMRRRRAEKSRIA